MGTNQSDSDPPETAPDDAEVEETRDVSDTPEDEVDEMVDTMLQGDNDTAVTTDSDDASEEVGVNDLTETSPDEVSVEELEEQEWTLGGEIEDEVINFKGTQFLLSEPEDDDILDIIAQQPGQTVDPKANMLKMCQAAVKAPEITPQRWENQMNMSERLGLTMRVAQFIGIEDFMDFPDSGAAAQPGL
jgi:hypothetical protein